MYTAIHSSPKDSNLLHMQGYILQLPSTRAAMGLRLPQLKPPSTADVEAQQQQQRPQMVRQASSGAHMQRMGRGRAIDPVKLLDVPTEIRKMASRSTDAHAMLLKASLHANTNLICQRRD